MPKKNKRKKSKKVKKAPDQTVRREWSTRAHFQQRVDQMGLDDDVVVEPPVRITKHAQQRIREGREGKYIWKKQQNRVVVITKLPKGTATALPRIHMPRKQTPTQYRAK